MARQAPPPGPGTPIGRRQASPRAPRGRQRPGAPAGALANASGQAASGGPSSPGGASTYLPFVSSTCPVTLRRISVSTTSCLSCRPARASTTAALVRGAPSPASRGSRARCARSWRSARPCRSRARACGCWSACGSGRAARDQPGYGLGAGHAGEPRMSATGAVTLGEQAGRVERLEVRCRRCERHGRLRLARLIADHGAGTGLPNLTVRLAAGCPKAAAPDPGRAVLRLLPAAAQAVLAPSPATVFVGARGPCSTALTKMLAATCGLRIAGSAPGISRRLRQLRSNGGYGKRGDL